MSQVISGYKVKTVIWINLLLLASMLSVGTALALPVADAGPDQYVNEGTTVTLDASGSTGGIVSYQWILLSGPPVTPSPSWDVKNPSFTAPPPGGEMAELVFNLNVMDSSEYVDTDIVTVNVFPAGAAIVGVATTPGGDSISIQLGGGSNLTRFIINSPESYTQTSTAGGPEPLDLPYGLADIQTNSQLPITSPMSYTSTVTFFLPGNAPPGYGWAKLSLVNGDWLDFSNQAVFNAEGTVVTVTLTDNGFGDDNPALGIINDPSGLALMPGGGSSGSGNCFIATAAYGSSVAPQVKLLRKFRDRFLLTSIIGTSFVEAYYTYSPPMADFIADYDTLRTIIRWGLFPLIGFSWVALQTGFTGILAMMTLLFIMMIVSVNYVRKTR